MRRRIVRSEAEKEECFMRLEETERYIETVIQKVSQSNILPNPPITIGEEQLYRVDRIKQHT